MNVAARAILAETRLVFGTISPGPSGAAIPFTRWIAPLLALVVSTLTMDAAGQDATALAARRELIEQSQRDRTAGNHTAALDRASRAARIQMTPSLRLFIAQEYNSLGQLAEAYGESSRCASEAEADQSLANRPTILASCRALANTLRDRIGRVTITAATVPPDLAITVNDHRLDDALLGVPYPVTPGTIVVAANAPGYQPFRRVVPIATNQLLEVRIDLQRHPGSSSLASAAATAQPDRGERVGTPTRVETAEPVRPTRIEPARHEAASASPLPSGPWLLGGGGVIALAISGLLFGAHYQSLGGCPMNACATEEDRDLVYRTSSGALIALGIGVAALGGGLIWGLTRGTPPTGHTPATAHAWITPLYGGLAMGIGGAF